MSSICTVNCPHISGGAGIGGVLVTTINPILTIIITSLIYKNKLSKNKKYGIFLGFLGGLFLLNVFQFGLAIIVEKGNIFFVLCALIWSILTIYISKNIDLHDSISFSCLTYFLSAIILFPFVQIKNLVYFLNFDIIFWIHFLIVSIGALSFGTTTFFWASSKLGPAKTSAFIFTVPISAIFTSVIILEEQIDLFTAIGCVLAITAVLLINR